jgi:purine-binding chemotaxis protein CheW
MPLVPANSEVRVKRDGAQPLLVFAEEGRSMALVVDEIVDIVEERLDIELASPRPGVLGSAVIKGQATEVIDIAHYLPLAFENGSHAKDRAGRAPRRVLLIDDAPFFRHMLSPILKAAGYAVTAVGSGREALALMAAGLSFDAVITDIEMPGMSGFELASALRNDPRTSDVPIIGLSSLVSADADRGPEGADRRHGLRGVRTTAMSGTEEIIEYVTATIGGQLFGLPIARVQDVFVPDRLARVPLAPPEVAGLLNLRGRIVTAIDMRRRLGLPVPEANGPRMAIGIECRGESYGLLIDAIGEVVKLDAASREDNPVNLDGRLARVSAGVHRLEGSLMVVLDVDRVLEIGPHAQAA